MRDLFKKDLTIKIVAILAAILFWLYVYNNSNPYITAPFNVPLKIENEPYLTDNGYIVKNKYKSSIDVTVRGRQTAIDKLRSSDFEASLDFSQVKSIDDKSLAIMGPYCSQKGIEIVSFQPEVIDIQLARNKSNSFMVELVNNITTKPGYKVLKTVVSPETITIVNEEALIDSVASIKALIDIKDLDRSISKKVDCKVYSKDGKEITGMSRNLKVDVSVEVAKEVPVTLITKGKPSPDFVETIRLITPEKMLITGAPELLAKITDVKTEVVDIEGLKQNLSMTPVIKLPDGVKFAEGQKEAVININIEKLVQKDMTVLKKDIRLINAVSDGTLKYDILTESLALQLRGRALDLNSVNLGSMMPGIDVTGLAEGTHKLPLNLILPAQVKQLQDVYIEVKVLKGDNVPI